ncbi:MAG: glycoside hydrolase family 1 protein [Spirochaetota bacterium]
MADRLPDDLLLGTATAGLQIEGGPARNQWYRWADEGHIADGSHPSRANDHWARFREDVGLLRELGVQTHRMGIEWSRIEPEEGVFDAGAIEHYREELELLRSAGIVPLVTLHHFTNPLWLEDDGGWTDPRVVDRFDRYVRRVVHEYGGLVEDWVTINEPNVYLYNGFVTGDWPPGRSSIRAFLAGAREMIRAHLRAYGTIHEIAERSGRDARVGVAHHLRVLDPAGSIVTPLIARLLEHVFHGIFLEGMTCGRLRWPLRGALPEAEGRARSSDFLGLNYYTRDIVRFAPDPSQLFAKLDVAAGAPVNDLGWEIYPAGLSRLARSLWRRYRLPIWVTENGTCDARDAFRGEFIQSHLREIVGLLEEDIPIERYYHWTLMDNFEWAEGEAARFGLYACDFETQERTLRASGERYREICRSHVI